MKFTTDWFSPHLKTWDKVIVPEFKGKPISVLEIGSYEGRSAIWMLDTILDHPASTITCVDTFNPKLGYEKNFDSNIAECPNKFKLKKTIGNSGIILKYLRESENKFDFIYIDGDHTKEAVLLDAELSWPMLKGNGIMCFDDYTHPKYTCKQGVDLFLEYVKGKYIEVSKNHQLIIRRID